MVTVAGVHTYCVEADHQPVLVQNCNPLPDEAKQLGNLADRMERDPLKRAVAVWVNGSTPVTRYSCVDAQKAEGFAVNAACHRSASWRNANKQALDHARTGAARVEGHLAAPFKQLAVLANPETERVTAGSPAGHRQNVSCAKGNGPKCNQRPLRAAGWNVNDLVPLIEQLSNPEVQHQLAGAALPGCGTS